MRIKRNGEDQAGQHGIDQGAGGNEAATTNPMKKAIFTLMDEQYARLEKLAAKQGVSKAEALRRAIILWHLIENGKEHKEVPE